MRKLPARKMLGAIIAGVLLLPETAFTLGLGEIEVNSALNQKLKADIELLSATPEDTENIIVKLASRKEFSRAGLDRPYLLNDLRFKSEVVDGIPLILVSTGKPVREPFLNFLVEIDWPNGHLIREYTVLLDPPVFMTAPASTATAPAMTNGSSSRPGSGGSTNVVPVVTPAFSPSARPEASNVAPAPQQNTNQASTQTYVPAPYIQPQTTSNQPSGSYRIATGDTAWSLANAMRPDQSVSVEQMMVAMLHANPESFINENINGLKRGYILRVPDYDQIVSLSQQDARALVREQAALWRQYQQTHAGGQPASAMPSDNMSDAGAAGSAVTGEDDAYLEIVSAGTGASTMGSKDPTQMTSQELRAELALARERVETERVEKEALQRKIDGLEQNVGKMKGMLSIEDDELSDIQALGMPADDMMAGSEPTEGEMLEADTVEDAKAEMAESIADTNDLLAEQDLEDAIAEADDEPAMEGEAGDHEAGDHETGDAEEALFLDEASEAEQADMHDDAMHAEPVIEENAAAEQPAIVTRPPADPLSKLLSDPILLAAAGGGLLLILIVIGLIIKKRREASADTEPYSLETADDFDELADEIAASAAQDSAEVADEIHDETEVSTDDDFDADSTMLLDGVEDTIIAEEDASATPDDDSEEPRDDVIAEADVYLAYGIYQQAEELLTQAISDNPERDDYRVKLAETHYASKNTEAFIEVATEIKQRSGDELTPAWKKVMGMGQDLCADNVLFQGSMVGGLDVDSLSPKTPEMDFDLGVDGASNEEDTPDLDLSLDEQPLDLPEMEDDSEDNESAADTAGEIEFDLSDTGAVEEAPVAEDEFSLDIDATELDIDVHEEETIASETDEVHEVSDVDIDFGLDDDATTIDDGNVADEEIEIDLTAEADALDLDLGLDEGTDTEETGSTDEVAPALAEDSIDEEDFDLSSLDDVDEISTKLDLARAYLDMGDHEGTRGILEEVIAEGSDEQKEEANELMAKLD